MKINKIFIGGLAVLSLTACNDFLDVDPASNAVSKELVYNSASEVDKALNGVYASLLSSETFGKNLYTTFQLNSDVDFVTKTQETAAGNLPQRFDTRADAGNVNKLWNNLYAGVETCNEFINGLEDSKIYAQNMKSVIEGGENGGATTTTEVPDVTDLTQKMGEAKVIRAMFYNDLVDLWGDVPFTFTPTSEKKDYVTPIVSRDEIRTKLIEDLREAAPKMSYARKLDNTIEHVSKEACWAMIARLALSAGGYSLRPDKQDATNHGVMQRPENYKEFYTIARNYADSVIKSNTHHLTKSYRNVFIDECNFVVDNSDDPIFEIPFTKENSGSIGYIQGPAASLSSGYSIAPNVWGETKGSAQVSAFYGYSFNEKDLRRDYVIGMWSYSNQGDTLCVPAIRADYTLYNNKWSKLWSNSGNFTNYSGGNTGINYPYLRYADVLLMFAEADNELNDGPTDAAKEALKTVRRRAFESTDWSKEVDAYVDSVSQAGVGERYNTAKKAFLRAVLNERKWEFAGENMRWKDLVRNNMYSEVLYYTFLRYYGVGENAGGTSQYLDAVEMYDFGVEAGRYNDLPVDLYYRRIANPKNTSIFPNTAMEILEIANPYNTLERKPIDPEDITNDEYKWQKKENNFGWWSEGDGTPTNQCLYSLYGFMRGDAQGQPALVQNNGQLSPIGSANAEMTSDKLPVVRYILPIPNAAIQRSGGTYKNYYGYAN